MSPEVAKKRRKCEKKLAADYGLRKFKDYRDPAGKGYIRARFLSVDVSIWTMKGRKGPSRSVEVDVLRGQVLARFDLRQSLGTTRAISVQLERAKRILEREQAVLREEQSITRVGHFNREPRVFIRHIRVLDLRASGLSWPDTARIVFPEEAAKLDRDEIKSRLVPRAKVALEVVKQYLQIAAMDTDSKQ